MFDHGGKRRGAGWPKGATKKGTQIDDFNLALQAQGSSKEMLDIIIDIARSSTSDNIRLVAASIVLDRGHGKPAQVKLPEPVSEFEESMILIGQQLRTKNMNRDAPLMGRSYESDLDSEGD